MPHRPREQRNPTTHPLEDHPDYVGAIGMVALETIALEIRLANLLAGTLGLPPRIGQAIYLSPKAEQTRLDILKNAAKSRLSVSPRKKDTSLGRQQTAALERVNDIVNRAQALIGERHRVVHDEWNYSETEEKVTRKRVEGKPGNPRVPTPRSEIDTLIRKLRVLIDDAHDLTESFRKHPPFMADLRKDSTKPSL